MIFSYHNTHGSKEWRSGVLRFPLSSKTNISKFQFDQESGRRGTTKKAKKSKGHFSTPKQSIFPPVHAWTSEAIC